jgi:putative ABC transport system substrate-binding protein
MARGRKAYSMSRRRLCWTLAGILAAPVIATGQAPRVRRIGVLATGAQPTQAGLETESAALRSFGWVEGQNLLIERRIAERVELLRPLAEELARLKVEIIVTWGTPAALAAKSATTSIPIVIGSAADPVRSGLVASRARPGGNITGYSILGPEIEAKRLSLLRELLPDLQRVGVLETPADRIARADPKELEQVCRSLGFEPIIIRVAAADELEAAIAEMVRRRAQALYLQNGTPFGDNPVLLMSAAFRYKLPTIADNKELADAGAILVYAESDAEANQRWAAFVDRILRGAKPADLPIEQPTKFELIINLKAAKSLALTIPQSLLLRADEVIQ